VALEQALRPAPGGLSVVTHGTVGESSSLSAEALRWLMSWLASRCDLVFIDGPVWDDAAEQAALVGVAHAVFLVVEDGQAARADARAASRAVARLGGRLGGLIVTR